MNKNLFLSLFFVFAFVVTVSVSLCYSHAQSTKNESLQSAVSKGGQARNITIEKVENERSNFAVLVNVDRADCRYSEGDTVVVTAKSSADGFLYLLHIGANGAETVLIPNEYQANNEIKANAVISFPAPSAGFRFRVSAPFGKETIKAFVTKERLKSVDLSKFTTAVATALDNTTSTNMLKELEQRSKDIVIEPIGNRKEDFATHSVTYTSYAKGDTSSRPTEKSNRYAICIGVEKYKDSKITSLSAAVNDAKEMSNLFVKHCGVPQDNCAVLTNEQVTLEIVRKVLCDVLPAKTKPGDVIFFYWSGHGSRLSATWEDNAVGSFAHYLVPFDGDTSKPRDTMLMEGPFGQWVMKLNGRKLVFILDACHSGRMAAHSKEIASSNENTSKTTEPSLLTEILGENGGSKSLSDSSDIFEPLTFGFTQLARSKALGQNGLVVLASSTGDELSFERREGDLSVMTYYLIDAIKNGSSGMTHKSLKGSFEKKVQEYIRKNYPSAKQSVVEQDDLNPALILKP